MDTACFWKMSGLLVKQAGKSLELLEFQANSSPFKAKKRALPRFGASSNLCLTGFGVARTFTNSSTVVR